MTAKTKACQLGAANAGVDFRLAAPISDSKHNPVFSRAELPLGKGADSPAGRCCHFVSKLPPYHGRVTAIRRFCCINKRTRSKAIATRPTTNNANVHSSLLSLPVTSRTNAFCAQATSETRLSHASGRTRDAICCARHRGSAAFSWRGSSTCPKPK